MTSISNYIRGAILPVQKGTLEKWHPGPRTHTWELAPRIQDPLPGTRDPGPIARTLDLGPLCGTRDLEPSTCDPSPGTQDPQPGTRTMDLYVGLGTWDPSPGTRDPICGMLFKEQIRGTKVRKPILFIRAQFFAML